MKRDWFVKLSFFIYFKSNWKICGLKASCRRLYMENKIPKKNRNQKFHFENFRSDTGQSNDMTNIHLLFNIEIVSFSHNVCMVWCEVSFNMSLYGSVFFLSCIQMFVLFQSRKKIIVTRIPFDPFDLFHFVFRLNSTFS